MDINGANETKTAITGTVDSVKKRILFKEVRLLATKSATGKNNFCFLHAQLKISSKAGTTILKGHFEGYQEDGKTICAKGDITLLCAADVLAKLLAIADTTTPAKTTPTDTLKKVIVIAPHKPAAAQNLTVSPGKTVELNIPATDITMEVWDNNKIDGDMISIMVNGQTILNKYTLTAIPKVLDIHLNDNQTNIIQITALNEGDEPPNTARIKLRAGNAVLYYIDASTTIQERVTFMIKAK
jgi:hypothetical protein